MELPLNLVCNPATISVVGQDILLNGKIHEVVVEKGLVVAGRDVYSPMNVSYQSKCDESLRLSPSAHTHHLHGWLASNISVIGGKEKPEKWRLGNWENVDVHRYIHRRYHPI